MKFDTHLLNTPCPYIKYWPEDGSLELIHVANYVLVTIYCAVLCLNKSLYEYCITQRDGAYQKKKKS